jgi:hypothetical protein
VHPDHEVDPSCSFGVARMEPHEDIGSLSRAPMRRANGRNRLSCSTGAMIMALDRAA